MANQPKKYKKFVATAATATLVASAIVPVASAASLSDIAGNTHETAINALVDAKVISGYPDGTFKPNKELTRSDVVKLLGKFLVTQGYEIPSDAASNPRFSDLNSKSNKELLDYAAVVNDAGVFAGSNGKLLAGDKITRENMAIVLVRMINTLNDASLEEYVEGQDFTKEVKDLNAAKAEARSAINVLDFYDITTATNFLPKNTVTRGQFATFVNNVIKADFTGASSTTGTVKAINTTTVEVAFGSDIENIKDLDFKIEGLEISNAIVKQTAKNVAVLTTAAQEGGKEYTVTVDGTEFGKFTGIAAVIPTSIKVETTSVQSKVGSQVTLKATTTPGAQVTFNVQATGNSLNENKKHEVTAGTDGVATFTYTQYGVAGVDNVTVYPTGAPNLLGYAKVYWGQDIILTVDADEKTVDNGGNRVYKVTYKDATTGQPVSGKTLNVTFKENLNDIDASKTNDTTASIRKNDGLYVTPYQDTAAAAGSNREEAFQITTNSVGEATFTVTGKNTTSTPIVFEDTDKNSRYAPTELQATAGVAKFQGVQTPYTITFERTADFVAAMSQEYGQQNPIAYKLKVVTDKKNDKGEAIPYVGATIKVAIQQNIDAPLNNNTPAQIASSENGTYYINVPVSVTTDAKGEATVYLKSAVDNTKATPVAWIDLNTAGNNATVGNDRLEEGEPNGVAPTVTFLKSVVVAPAYSLNTPTAGAYIGGDRMTWKASLTNQSNNVSETAGIKNATYTVTNTSNRIVTINPQLLDVNGDSYTNLTITYNGQTQTQPFTNGSSVNLEPGTTVTIHGNAPGLRNEYGQTTITQNGTTIITSTNQNEYSTTNDALLHVVAPNVNGSLSVSSNVTTVRKLVTQDTRNNNNTYTYDAKVANFINVSVVGNNNSTVLSNPTVTGEVIGYDVIDKTTAPSTAFVSSNKFNRTEDNNFGRVVIKERHTGVVKAFFYDSVDTFSAALDANFNAQTDNVLLGATPFEALLSLNDEVQVNNTNSPSNQVGTVRLFNKDASTGGTTNGNGTAAVVKLAITNATTKSTNGTTIDKIEVTFNKAITQADVNALQRIVGSSVLTNVSLNNTNLTLANPVLTGTNTITLDLVTPVTGTDALHGQPLVFNLAASVNGPILDLSTVIKDGVTAKITSAVPVDADRQGNLDTVTFTFSESVNLTTADATDFRFYTADASNFVSGKTVKYGTNADGSANSKQLVVEFDNRADITTTVNYSYAHSNSAAGNTVLLDNNGFAVASQTGSTTPGTTPPPPGGTGVTLSTLTGNFVADSGTQWVVTVPKASVTGNAPYTLVVKGTTVTFRENSVDNTLLTTEVDKSLATEAEVKASEFRSNK